MMSCRLFIPLCLHYTLPMRDYNCIIELRQTAENDWKALYQGNYGIYIIEKVAEHSDKKKLFDYCLSEMKNSDKKDFSSSAAKFLIAENEAGRLLGYIEKHFSADRLEEYYKVFAPSYPAETLEMFKKVLVPFAKTSMGRSHYERMISLLNMMSAIKGGKNAASELVSEFRLLYKSRKLMMEMLSRF